MTQIAIEILYTTSGCLEKRQLLSDWDWVSKMPQEPVVLGIHLMTPFLVLVQGWGSARPRPPVVRVGPGGAERGKAMDGFDW